MDPETREQIRQIRKMVDNNNTLLKQLRKTNRMQSIGRALKWAIYLLLAYFSYQALEPVIGQLQQMMEMVGGLSDDVGALKAQGGNAIDSLQGFDVQGLLNSFKQSQ